MVPEWFAAQFCEDLAGARHEPAIPHNPASWDLVRFRPIGSWPHTPHPGRFDPRRFAALAQPRRHRLNERVLRATCVTISPTTTGGGRTSRSTRMLPCRVWCNRRPVARSFRSPTSAACINTTNVAPPDPRGRGHRACLSSGSAGSGASTPSPGPVRDGDDRACQGSGEPCRRPGSRAIGAFPCGEGF
jgi:hypothetical protein